MISVLDLQDIHASNDPVKDKKFNISAGQVIQYCETHPVDYVKIDGDVYDTALKDPFFDTDKDGLGIRSLENFLTRLSSLVKFICITKGNAPQHDLPGSISKLHKRYAQNILAHEYPVVLAFESDGNYTDLLRNSNEEHNELTPEIIIVQIPYPTKSMLMKYAKDIDSSNAQYGQIFDGLMQLIGGINAKYSCPKIMGAHLNIEGSRLCNGQDLPGHELIISPQSLLKAGCDFYNNGHIHLFQWIIPDVMCYGSSFYNKDFGETDQKYFHVVRFENGQKTVEIIPLTGSKPMVNVKAEWKNGELIYEKPEGDCEAKVQFDIPVNEIGLLTNEKIERLKKDFGDDVKIAKNVIPAKRESRSTEIMNAKTDQEEVEEYLNVAYADDKDELGLPVENGRIKFSVTMTDKLEQMKNALARGEKEITVENEE